MDGYFIIERSRPVAFIIMQSWGESFEQIESKLHCPQSHSPLVFKH